jgi:hypothetical protein
MQISLRAARPLLASGTALATSLALAGVVGAQGTTPAPPSGQSPAPTTQGFGQFQTSPQNGSGGWIRERTQRYPRNRNNRNRGRSNNGNARIGHINPGDKAPVDLTSSVQSLKERHATAVMKLPVAWRPDERRALAVVDQLPFLAQESYLLTIEDYPNLDAPTQAKLGGVIRGLGELPAEKQTAYISAATRTFDTMGADKKKLAAARKTPHEACFQLTHDLTTPAALGR